MALVMPPPPPQVGGVPNNDGIKRLHFRMAQVLGVGLTVGFTAWFFSMGMFPGILSVFISKHILVAILAAGLHLPEQKS